MKGLPPSAIPVLSSAESPRGVEPTVELALGVLKARDDDRIDDMLTGIHPDCHWLPLARPGLSVYRGHDGIRRMLDDLARTRGVYRTTICDATLMPDERVLVCGRITPGDGGEEVAFEVFFTFRDGLIVKADAHERAGS